MHMELQHQLVKRVFDQLDGHTPKMAHSVTSTPASSYTCSERLRLETQLFFRQRPLLITLSCRLPHPGDYFTDDLSGVPILLIRGDDGKVNAFLNACRHRGARVATGCGSNRRAFSCPYHGWTYGRDGGLRRLTPGDAFAGLAASEHGLIRLPVQERHGMIWVVSDPDDDAPDGPPLGLLDEELGQYGFGGLSHYETQLLQPHINWKLMIDGFLENWHFHILHQATIAPIFIPWINLFDDFGADFRLVYPRRSIDELRQHPEERWALLPHSVVIYLLFPNTLVLWQGDHVELWRVFPAPDGVPGRCVAEISLYTPEPVTGDSAREHWRRNMALLMRTVVEEDFPLAEGIQANLATGMTPHLLFGRNEPALQHYHRTMEEILSISQISASDYSAFAH